MSQLNKKKIWRCALMFLRQVLLTYNLHTIKCTLSVSSSMSFDKWIQLCNHNQDIEHFHHLRKFSVKDFSKGGCASLDKQCDTTSILTLAATPWGGDPQFSLAALSAKVAAWDLFHNETFLISQTHELCLLFRPSGEFLAFCSVQNCSYNWSSLALGFKVDAGLGIYVSSIQRLLLLP